MHEVAVREEPALRLAVLPHRGPYAGIGGAMLRHIIAAARATGMRRLSLETGSWPYFAPARALYAAHGFVECGPFEGYGPDPNSVFMTLDLAARQTGVRGLAHTSCGPSP